MEGIGSEQLILARSMACGISTIYLTSFEDIGRTSNGPDRKNFKVYHNGSWCKGKKTKSSSTQMYKIITENNKELVVSGNYLNLTLRGKVPTNNLTTDDYLMFNTRPLNSYREQDLHLTYEQGFVVGLFLGCGSFGRDVELVDKTKIINEIRFSLCENNYKHCMEIIDKVNVSLGGKHDSTLPKPWHNSYPVRISSRELVDFLIYWTGWKRGVRSHTMQLNMECLLQSIEFREGILDGWHLSDGDMADNIGFTTSLELTKQIETLITSLGKVSKIDIINDIGKVSYIRGNELIHKRLLYKVRWYEITNRRSISNVYKICNNSIYFKIRSIEKINILSSVFSFKMKNEDEPYFTLPNGIIVCGDTNEY